ncbi:serine/threonine-protein kinase [Mesorhizobium sp. INR15]|uniref:serine/threonine-protein kinase n=1 Tax=Mesorhizobium sp. INR15 TaxID=2654248 RepID=UPI0018965AC7|nr:serine/threonine-protein kinase [Mesorhizobium sp. INR15]QPC94485.1 protein kinase [Mesorhizobium sp. INR15]
MSADDKTRISPNMPSTAVGTQLSGIYELDERIAFGGMGEVYRGHNIQTGDHVAIKIVLPEFARDQTILSLFRKEASILNHLSHDAVVRYHVFTIDPGIGRPYLAMEFVDGESLFDVMRRGAMAVEDVRKLCLRLTSGLSAVHQAGAIHRDLSPDNIILPGGRVDRAKIIDFGIARSATVGGETLIGGKFAGKYNYVSPEQLGLYSGDVSEQSDMYSLGLVLAAVLRGKPIDMSGSQFEIIEKRRTVPDLSDIDADFRDIVEAMLQPDPKDRPASMAEIARLTRDDSDIEGTTPPRSLTPRDRAGLPRADGTLGPSFRAERPPSHAPGSVPPATGTGEQRFVPYERPPLLSQPRPPVAAGARAATPGSPEKSSGKRTMAIAALASLLVAAGAGLYLSGIVTLKTPSADKPPAPAPETLKPAPADNAAAPQVGEAPAKPVAPAKPQTETAPPVENQADAETGPKPAQPVVSPSPEDAKPPAVEAKPPTDSAPAAQPAPAPPVQNQADASIGQKPAPAKPAELPAPAAENVKPPAPEVKPQANNAPAIQPDTAASNAPKPEPITPTPPAIEATPAPPVAQPPVAEIQQPEQPASQPAETNATAQPPAPIASQTDAGAGQGQQTAVPAAKPPVDKQPDETVALNVPKPEIPPAKPANEAAQRVSWVRGFSGGDCFYATVTATTDKAVAIEGFGTAVQPFQQLLGGFQAKFHVEPDISVRLIKPTQCEVTNFLRFLGSNAVEKPQLELDRTSVPDGSSIGGTLVTHGGLISSVLLIDHKGMAFNLDDRLVAQSGKATFSIPIGLGAADKAAGKAVPQIIMVVTGPQDIQAASFSTPTPAAVVLPKILEEIETKGSEFSATAKYFKLGG